MPTVVVKGYTETVKALDRVNRKAKFALLASLRVAAMPIAEDTQNMLQNFNKISLDTIKPSATAKGVNIVQRKGKVTGKRPDFGAAQMVEGFIPAAYKGEPLLRSTVEGAFAALIIQEGL